MSLFSKFGRWVKKTAGNVGDALGNVSSVLLPVAGFAVGLLSPKLGETIGNLADKIGNKVSKITGIGDGKPGVLGIGDGLPGLLGIGTGKGKAKKQTDIAKLVLAALTAKEDSGTPLTPEEKTAKTEAEADMKKDGVNPLFLLGGGLLALFALRK